MIQDGPIVPRKQTQVHRPVEDLSKWERCRRGSRCEGRATPIAPPSCSQVLPDGTQSKWKSVSRVACERNITDNTSCVRLNGTLKLARLSACCKKGRSWSWTLGCNSAFTRTTFSTLCRIAPSLSSRTSMASRVEICLGWRCSSLSDSTTTSATPPVLILS